MPIGFDEGTAEMNNTAEQLLDRKEAMAVIRLKAAHFSKLVNGKIKGLPPLACVRIGRRQLFRSETLRRWILDVEAQSACKRAL